MRKFLLLAMCCLFFTGITGSVVSCFAQEGVDPADKILVLEEIANAQIEQIQFASENELDEVPGLVRAYVITVQAIEDSTEQVTAEVGLTQALEAVSTATARHIDILTALSDQVPEVAQPAIQHALSVSTTGGDTALDRLEGTQEGEMPPGRPEGVEEPGKPEGAGEPEEPGKPEGAGGSKGDGKPGGEGRP